MAFHAKSQELPGDSLKLELSEQLQSELFFSGMNLNSPLILTPLSDNLPSFFKQPLFPQNNFSIQVSEQSPVPLSFNPFFFSLPGTSFAVLNQAQYRINNQLSIGGNSIGWKQGIIPGNTPFEPMNFKAASMFLEYKVSKKFSIGAQISVGKTSPYPVP